jgi:hypothetical protein
MVTVTKIMDDTKRSSQSQHPPYPYCESSPAGESRLEIGVVAHDDNNCNLSYSTTGTGGNDDSLHTRTNNDTANATYQKSVEHGTPPDDIIIQNATMHTADATTAAGAIESRQERWERRKIVALYLATITILFADMNLLAPNLSIIADEFGMLTDDERDVKLGGMLALGFFFVGAPVSFIVGWVADSMNRSPLFAATVCFGEIGSLMVMFVRNYWQLYVCR